MKLFKLEGYTLEISEEAYSLKVFKDLWTRDKSKNKSSAIQELAYIYFMWDPRSDYQYIVDEEARKLAVISGTGMPDNWKPDKKVQEAEEFYKTFKTTAALLLEDIKFSIEKLRKYLRSIDLNETDEKGRPVNTLQTFTATLKQLPVLVKDLHEAEKALTKEMEAEGRMRGQGEKTIFEDSLDI